MSHVTVAERFELTEQQARFVGLYSEFGNATVAAERSGYSVDSAQQVGAALLRRPHVFAAIQYEARRRLLVGVPEMLGIVEAIARDERISPKIRLDASKTWLDRAGLVPPRAAVAKEQGEKALQERSAEELRDLANRLEQELAGRAKTVSAPKAPASDTNLSDLIE